MLDYPAAAERVHPTDARTGAAAERYALRSSDLWLCWFGRTVGIIALSGTWHNVVEHGSSDVVPCDGSTTFYNRKYHMDMLGHGQHGHMDMDMDMDMVISPRGYP